MQLEVNINGETRVVELSIDSVTLNETVAIKRFLGAETFRDTFGKGYITDPEALQAFLYVKLRDEFPDLQPDDFDVDMKNVVGDDDPKPTGS